MTVLVLAALVVILGSSGATRWRLARERGVNLEATRGSASPRVWLVAHIDSKSQPVSSAVRTIGVLLLTMPLLVGLFFRGTPARALGMAGGVILACAAVRSRSDGAADNASGVAAVLHAAAMIPRDKSLGVLITDAEELALAGATAWVEGRPRALAINCDTVDDTGRFVVFEYGLFSHELDGAVHAVRRSGAPLHNMRPPLGILTDSNAFSRTGWPSVTLARGTIRTLNRIHTRRDSLDNLRGTGIPDAARVLARLVEELA